MEGRQTSNWPWRTIMGLVLPVGVLLATAACAGEGEPPTTPTGTLTAPTGTIVGIDMDLTGNSATALGAIDQCISLKSGSEEEFEVDIFLQGLPADSVLGFGYQIWFPDTAVEIVGQDHSMLVAAEPESNFVDVSEDVPDASSPHLATVADIGAAEYNPPYTRGVLGRYTFKVLPTASAGVYALTLTEVVVGRDTMAEPDYSGYPVGGALSLDAIWDGNFDPQYGVIAVDVPCSSAPDTE